MSDSDEETSGSETSDSSDGHGTKLINAMWRRDHAKAAAVFELPEAEWRLEDGSEVTGAEDADEPIGATALVFAAWRGMLPTVELLLAKGADVAAADGNDFGALHWALENGHADCAEALAAAGAGAGDCEDSLLQIAARGGSPECVRLVLDRFEPDAAAVAEARETAQEALDDWSAPDPDRFAGEEETIREIEARIAGPPRYGPGSGSLAFLKAPAAVTACVEINH